MENQFLSIQRCFSPDLQLVRREEDLDSYFSFEMTHEPMSLFKDGVMRKPDKPALRKVLMPDYDETISTQQLHPSAIYNIDGGALNHRVRWIRGTIFEELALQYAKYTRKHYSSCYVIFDGYNKNTTKAIEHMRRSGGGGKCPDVNVQFHHKVPYTQDMFLTNDSNKTQLISLIASKLKDDGQNATI